MTIERDADRDHARAPELSAPPQVLGGKRLPTEADRDLAVGNRSVGPEAPGVEHQRRAVLDHQRIGHADLARQRLVPQ